MHRMPAQRGDEMVADTRRNPDSHRTADLLARYGELAAELEDTSDPTRSAHLRATLDELDHWISQRAHAARTRGDDPT